MAGMDEDVSRLTAAEASARLCRGDITAEQLARACLARIALREADVRAWSFIDPDAVIRQARELDKLPSRGPLHGMPVGVKDIFNTSDMPTQHNSPIYIGHRPNIDAAAVGTLRAAGALILDRHHRIRRHWPACGHAQSARPQPHSRRVVQRLGRGSGGFSCAPCARHADWWVADPSRLLLRRVRHETELERGERGGDQTGLDDAWTRPVGMAVPRL
jgi:hypothetical protein